MVAILIPNYTQVAWIFGSRFRALSDLSHADVAALSDAMVGAADARGLAPAGLHGAYGAPFTSANEVILGAVLNGAPVVRERAEMREGVLSRHHAAVQARFSLQARVHHSSDEDLSVEEDWRQHVVDAISEVLDASTLTLERIEPANDLLRPELSGELVAGGCAWHLVSKGGRGALVRGTLLPNAGAPYCDDLIETFECTDGDGVVARLVGTRLLGVDGSTPIASLPADLSHGEWQSNVYQRLETLTGKARAVNFYLWAE